MLGEGHDVIPVSSGEVEIGTTDRTMFYFVRVDTASWWAIILALSFRLGRSDRRREISDRPIGSIVAGNMADLNVFKRKGN